MKIQKYKVVLHREAKYTLEEHLNTPYTAHMFLKKMLRDEAQEVMSLVAVDAQSNAIGYFEVHRGTLTSSQVAPAEILKRLLLCNAYGAIIAHNHPSGCTIPSSADNRTYDGLKEILELVGIKLLDFIIIGDRVYSYMAKEYID